MPNKISNYISNLYDLYSKSIESNQSLSDTLKSFAQISEDYKKLNNIDEKTKEYSSSDLLLCDVDERKYFIDDQLQLIETLVCNSIYETRGSIWNWSNIVNLMLSKDYAQVEKTKRKVLYSTSSTNRPIGDVSYETWNGIQIIDLDIKNEYIANELKTKLFENLKKYKWFLGVCMSASKKSLHVWTKITPFTIEYAQRRIEYIANFRHKYSYIYIILLQYAKNLGYTKEDILGYMDMAMCKPQQAIFISSDLHPLINTNFQDLRLDINFESALSNGIESINWISHNDLKDIFHKVEWFSNNTVNNSVNKENIVNIENRDISKNKRIHYKHTQRWQLANTLTSLYGEENALNVMKEICKDTPVKELKGDIKTASIHNKPISLWAVDALNKNHGFNIVINKDKDVKDEIEQISEQIELEKDNSIDPTKILNDNVKKTILHLRKDQYLSDIKTDIVKNLGHITLLEAGAGYGKTEMIKSLKDKTLLILPFTSTIKAKVEADVKTSDWLYYYGSKRPTLEEILGNKNMAMTIDKFSRLNVMELDQANFKYIVIDESHLLYTSSYRDVMSPAIQRLANCSAKIIMMTGTPTGELLFFPGITHIKVIKEDYRIKEFEIHMCQSKIEKTIEMCKSMGNDIMNGKKILYPSNDGNLYYEQIIGIIQQYLLENNYTNPLRSFYYKKSNYGDQSMEDINIDKSIGNNDIIFCSTYLSVGVDICDKFDFSVYFSQLWIPQDIEQFANRLRNNDLYIKLFLEQIDSEGYKINYWNTKPLDLSFSKVDMLLVRDMIKTCNDLLERNDEESKYNPMISSLLSTNKFLKYDENDARYYIDETTYKLKIFEERYSDYSKQLNVLINGLKYYGYTVNIINHEERIPDDNIVRIEELLKMYRHAHYNSQTIKTFKFLNHINNANVDVYRDILKGTYGIFKDEEYKEKRETNNLYVEDIEIVMKNLPIYLGLYKFYEPEVIIDIFKYCQDKKSNRINYAMLNRIRKFVNIEDNRRKKRLDFPVYRFILDTQKWAKENQYVTKDEINVWVANYAAKIANMVKDVLVDNTQYFETIFELTEELFDVIIIKGRSKNGSIHIEPFELLWEKKIDIKDLYGGVINTKDFFLSDLITNMKTDESETNADEEKILNTDFPHTHKMTIDLISEEINNIINKPFDYFEYSKLDGSNDRFIRKQINTNQLKDHIFDDIENNTNEENNDVSQKDIFEDTL